MRFFVVLSSVAAFAAAQEIGVSGGDSVVAGTNAIDNPNVNNGVQADASLFAGGNSGGANIFHDVVGSQFLNANLNAAVQDNLANNVGVFHVGGNSGWTANGDANALGPVSNALARRGEYHANAPEHQGPSGYHANSPEHQAPSGYHANSPEHQAPYGYHSNAPEHQTPSGYHSNAPEHHAPSGYHANSPEHQTPPYHAPYVAVPIIVPPPGYYHAPIFHAYPPPVHKVPSTDKPVYKAPSTDKPVYKAPTTENPPYKAPSTDKPPYKAPVEDKPVYKAPSTDKPVYKAPVEDKPPYKAPTTENPPYKAPAGDRSPGAEKPAHYEAHEAPSYHAAAPAPVAVEHKQVATIIQNQA